MSMRGGAPHRRRVEQVAASAEPRAGQASRPLVAQVYAQLAAGGFQSGAALARQFGVSRNAVWKAVSALRELGLTLHAVRHRGYRLAVPCEPLDAAAIRAELAPETRRCIRRVDVVWSIDSTNTALLARTDVPPGLSDLLAAEYQTAGRGRLGRTWLASPGAAVCLSIGWSFPQLPRDLGALGLAIGVCALRALRARIPESRGSDADSSKPRSALALKWPNDLTLDGCKLGGILIEMRAESAGPTYVVVGIGVNLALGAQLREQVAATGTQAADLASAGADLTRRNALVAGLASEVVRGLAAFQQEGLHPFLDEWKAADSLQGRTVSVRAADRQWRGVARGIDASGALLVQTPQGLQKVISGDVSVRADAGLER